MNFISLEDFKELVGKPFNNKIIGATVESLKIEFWMEQTNLPVTEEKVHDMLTLRNLSTEEAKVLYIPVRDFKLDDLPHNPTDDRVFCLILKIPSFENFANVVRRINNLKAFL